MTECNKVNVICKEKDVAAENNETAVTIPIKVNENC